MHVKGNINCLALGAFWPNTQTQNWNTSVTSLLTRYEKNLSDILGASAITLASLFT